MPNIEVRRARGITVTPCTRRHFLACAAAFSASPLLGASTVTPADALDKCIEDFMKERAIPGGALAVVKNRRLVYTRGYGWADRDQKLPVIPESLFRIASISKPITAVAILKLAEQHKLALEDCVFELLRLGARLLTGTALDPRLRQITVDALLHHPG